MGLFGALGGGRGHVVGDKIGGGEAVGEGGWRGDGEGLGGGGVVEPDAGLGLWVTMVGGVGKWVAFPAAGVETVEGGCFAKVPEGAG